jgi:hypothetical protein
MNVFSTVRKKSFMTIISLIVTLQLLNTSFDPADPGYGSEDLSINEIESCLELILEIVMGHENAISESDESDEAPDKPGTIMTLYSIGNWKMPLENPSICIKTRHSLFRIAPIESLSLPITSPPPRLL